MWVWGLSCRVEAVLQRGPHQECPLNICQHAMGRRPGAIRAVWHLLPQAALFCSASEVRGWAEDGGPLFYFLISEIKKEFKI